MMNDDVTEYDFQDVCYITPLLSDPRFEYLAAICLTAAPSNHSALHPQSKTIVVKCSFLEFYVLSDFSKLFLILPCNAGTKAQSLLVKAKQQKPLTSRSLSSRSAEVATLQN